MRARLSRLVVFAASIALAASAASAADVAPVRIPAILSLTGAGAFLGSAEARTLAVVQVYVNAHGGVRGRPVQFDVRDDQTTPQTTVQLASQLASEKVAMVIGPSSPQGCAAVQPLVEKNGPVTYCLIQSVHPAPGGFVFATGHDSKDVVAVALRYLRERNLNRVALLMGTDASGADFDRGFEAAFAQPENAAIKPVAHEHFAAADLSVAAQVSRIKAAAPDVLITWTAGTPFGTVARGAFEGGLGIPILTSGANMTLAQMEQYGSFLPKDMLFAGQIAWTPGGVPPGPVRDAQALFVRTLKAAGYASDAGYTTVWDPALLFVDALRKLGPDVNAEQLRAYLAGVHGWVGIDGTYDFTKIPQRGLGENAGEILGWHPVEKAFVAVSKPAGYLR
jgi:branched-chain amino acid transport system substrate-binding protein